MLFNCFNTLRLVFSAVFVSSLLGGCTGFFSGYREVPVSQESMGKLTNFMDNEFVFSIPPINDRTPGKIVFVMGFDGTNNDRRQVPYGETKTVVAQVIDAIHGNEIGEAVRYPGSPVLKGYLPGPGCADSWWCLLDQATGRSSTSTAEDAFKDLQRFMSSHPSATEVRVVVIGFSRGAATARHFLNQVYRASKDGLLGTSAKLWSSAILVETVATGQTDTLHLSMPPNLEFGLHLVAKNETRTLFPPIIDNDDEYQSYAHSRSTEYFKRLFTVYLPGAHSDLGDSYQTGAGPEVTKTLVNVIETMGLGRNCREDCPESNLSRRVNDGLHDSRGKLDWLLGVTSPYSKGFERSGALTVRSTVEDVEGARLYEHMNRELLKYTIGIGTSKNFKKSDNFVFTKEQEQCGWTQTVGMSQIKGYVEIDDGVTALVFPAEKLKRLELPEVVRQAIKEEPGKVVLEAAPFNDEFWWFVNGYIPGEE